jgi:hypothetical protein
MEGNELIKSNRALHLVDTVVSLITALRHTREVRQIGNGEVQPPQDS